MQKPKILDILSAKTEKSISKMIKTENPNAPPPSSTKPNRPTPP